MSSTYTTFWSLLSTFYTLAKGTIVASTGISILLSGLLYFKQTSLIYPRDIPAGARTEVPTPDEFDITDWERVKLYTKDGETLNSYFVKARKKSGVTVLYMHGNAGNIGHRLPLAQVFSDQMGCNVFMLGYRGYGLSTGRPSEKGLNIDAQTALNFLLEHADSKDGKIFVYGQSLGGALAIQLVAKNQGKIHGLILENTFRSMRTLIPSAFPPAKYLARLCHQIWPSETTIPTIEQVPVLFLSGSKDELVPPEHMQTLYNVTVSPKIMRKFLNGGHNDTYAELGYFDAMLEFISQIKHGRPIAELRNDAVKQEKIPRQSGSSMTMGSAGSRKSVATL
ncbi:Alpha/Beta hydrolase protein [Pyronema domesticum]|uniref:Similar to Protein bem46 acc. no. P54069 n=1 Tax=Pyronema omphalodes (strain CBS 100304) TaxID=1076935 RepID=U4LHX1_PYROM|nr:Alpha/Beta hydrolase protein [Pyronema domesticum]CCX11761.1 Similar to Protein bem46; acc. no. P54069 [Pyronema omphalodes CBS 100304]